METDAEAAQQNNERGELVTDILQRRLSCLSIPDSPRHHLLSLLPSNDVVADVVFHVRRSNSDHQQNLPCMHIPADENPDVLRMLAHSFILRRESDYFREILQRPADDLSVSADDQEQDDPDYLQQEEHASNVRVDASTPASSMDGMPQDDLPMYMQEELVPPIVHANSPNQSITASTMNDMIGCEVLAHVQAQIKERFNDEDARWPSAQEFYSCKSSFASAADGDSVYQKPESTFDDDASSCSMSIATTQLPATSSMSTAISTLHRSSPATSLSLPPSDNQPRKSILLSNDDQKGSITRSMRKSMRKSVRFSLELQADIILPTSMANNCIDTGGKQADEETDTQESSNNFVNQKGLSSCEEVVHDRESTREAERVSKLLIKRRHTEVNMVMERGRGTANNEKKEIEEDASQYSFKFFVVKKLTWTAPVLISIMEWLYLGVCHVNLEDLPGLYDAAYRAVITSLTWCIRRHSMPAYLNLALSNPVHCKSLLDLCLIADCIELSSLKGCCEALQAMNGQPKIAILETKPLPGDDAHAREVLSEGFFVLDGHPLCVLKSCRPNEFESPRDYESHEPLPFLTFARHPQPSPSSSTSTFYQQKSISNCKSTLKEQTWKVVMLDDDPAGSFYAFFKYVAMHRRRAEKSISKKQGGGEEGHLGAFKLQMITRFKVGSILVQCLRKAIGGEGIKVREERGAGAFIKGPSYCTSIVIKGDPWRILMAAKAIPYDMVGRSALKIRAPCAKTFSSLFHACHTFGVHLPSHSIVLVKPLYVLIKVLEFITNLNSDAFEAPSTERTFIELNQPTEPF